MKRALMGFLAAVALCLGGPASAQTTTRLSIGTGGTGGVYYPLGGGMAAILSKHVPGWEATAEVTGASVANLQLIGQGKQDFLEAELGGSVDIMRRIKKSLDPLNIFNPGKIFALD